MPYVKVDTSVPRHRKFVKAGPAPSWLWLCGNCYCQDGLTDGFIPEDALPYMGVKNAKQLAAHLVKAGLWDITDGGWLVHDYLKHNKRASEVRRIQEERRDAGTNGGKASGEARRKQVASHITEATAKQTANPATATATATAAETATGHADVWVRAFIEAYPGQGKCASHLLETAFFAIVGTDRLKFDSLLARLEAHKRSAQWVSGKIPRADRYLREGLHLQTLPEVAQTPAPARGPAWVQKARAQS